MKKGLHISGMSMASSAAAGITIKGRIMSWSSVLLLPFVLAPAFPGMAWPPFFTPSWAPLLKSWSSASRDPPSAQTPLARRLPCLSSGLHSLVGCWTSTCSCASLVWS